MKESASLGNLEVWDWPELKRFSQGRGLRNYPNLSLPLTTPAASGISIVPCAYLPTRLSFPIVGH